MISTVGTEEKTPLEKNMQQKTGHYEDDLKSQICMVRKEHGINTRETSVCATKRNLAGIVTEQE